MYGSRKEPNSHELSPHPSRTQVAPAQKKSGRRALPSRERQAPLAMHTVPTCYPFATPLLNNLAQESRAAALFLPRHARLQGCGSRATLAARWAAALQHICPPPRRQGPAVGALSARRGREQPQQPRGTALRLADVRGLMAVAGWGGTLQPYFEGTHVPVDGWLQPCR